MLFNFPVDVACCFYPQGLLSALAAGAWASQIQIRLRPSVHWHCALGKPGPPKTLNTRLDTPLDKCLYGVDLYLATDLRASGTYSHIYHHMHHVHHVHHTHEGIHLRLIIQCLLFTAYLFMDLPTEL